MDVFEHFDSINSIKLKLKRAQNELMSFVCNERKNVFAMLPKWIWQEFDVLYSVFASCSSENLISVRIRRV